MANLETDASFIIGVDTHKQTHTASIVDTRGAELQAIERGPCTPLSTPLNE